MFQKSKHEIKRKVCRKFVAIVKEGSGEYVERYQDAFFRCRDMIHLDKKDQNLIIDQVINRVTTSVEYMEIEICNSLSRYLDISNVTKLVDPFVKTAIYNENSRIKRKAIEYLKSEFMHTEVEDAFLKRIDDWIKLYESRKNTDYIDLLKDIKDAYEIPF